MRTFLTALVASALLFAMNTVAPAQGLISPSPELPPDGVYVSPLEFHEYSAMGIVLDDPTHRPFADTAVRVRVGNNELEIFDSEFTAVEIGLGLGSLTLTGPVEVMTTDRALSTSGLFDTEIVSMSLTGAAPVGPILIREDPSRASTGETEITDLGGGLYHIDSFFDVFTELSVDGGQSWVSSDTSTRMYLVPEPGTITLLGLASLVLLGAKRQGPGSPVRRR